MRQRLLNLLITIDQLLRVVPTWEELKAELPVLQWPN
jgi:hypothetical protein